MNRTVLSIFGVEPFRIGSNEAFARELSSQLHARDWISVLCFLTEPPPAVREYLSLPNVRFEVLPRAWELRWDAAMALRRIVRRHRPRILHLHYTGFLSPYPWIARLGGLERVFFTDHNSRPAHFVPSRAPLWKRAITQTVNWPITKVIAVSDYGYRCLAATGLLPEGRLQRIYNGIDFSAVNPDPQLGEQFRAKHGIPRDRTVIVQVSWMIPEKGIPDLIEAARLVTEASPGAHFALVGEGKHRTEYTDRVRQLGLERQVTFTGLVENPFREGVFAAADIVCQFSHWEEVFGWVIAEAMAYRRPLVATRVGGIPELVQDNVTGFLVERSDTRAMADRLLQLIADPTLRQRFGAAGRAAAEQSFDVKKNVAELLRSYGVV